MKEQDKVGLYARAAASRLSDKLGERVLIEVESALHTHDGSERPKQYTDPVALGSLIVSIASLGWTIFSDLRKRTPRPSKEVVARKIRVELPPSGVITDAQQNDIIDVVVDTITQELKDPSECKTNSSDTSTEPERDTSR